MEANATLKTTFILRSSKDTDSQIPIYCRITINSERSEFSIRRSVEARLWDREKVKGNTEEAKATNAYIKQIEAKIFEIYRDMLVRDKKITALGLRNAFLGKTDESETKHTLLGLIEYHNTHLKDTLEWGTLKNYFTTQKYIKMFLIEKLKKSDIKLSDLNYKFLADFEMFLKAHQPIDHHKPCGQNTAMKHIERFRKMVNLAIRYEWLQKDPFVKFRPNFKKTIREYLTEHELQSIENKNFKIERLKLVKDLFVFSCYTGLAYIDVMNLTEANMSIGLDGNCWISTSRQKTDTYVRIPLLPKAKEIIEKYKGNPKALAEERLFPGISNQKLNTYLKEIADVCGIEKNLTFHLARHTFATTVTLTNGVPMETVSKLLGHSSIRTTQIYAKVVEKKVSEDMELLKSKLFKTSNKMTVTNAS